MGLFQKIFGTYSDHQIKKLIPTVDKIEELAETMAAKSDAQLRAMTDAFKNRLKNGETLEDILPEAFAVVREADWRVLGKRPFRVQLMGGIVLHQGRIAEMKTGEGKTLVATLPAYLNALTGEGVHIVTVNEYLARVGMEEMGRVYEFLGLTTGLIIRDQTGAEKRAAYNCDITYGTNNEFGFDYLRDNRVLYREQLTQRGHIFAIVDEVDSILIDEARTPLIISGEGEESTDLYDRADAFVRKLKPFKIKEMDDKVDTTEVDGDYIIDEKARTATITEAGVKKAEEHFGIENLSDPENTDLAHHIHNALRAHGVYQKDVDYVEKDGQIIIVDAFTGRLMYGRRFSDGMHQAIEAKEHVKIQKESKTLATITFQNYFRMYKKLSGMTGTALTEENEFREIYNLDVVAIPTNMPMIRIDHADAVYKNKAGKYRAIVNKVIECHEKGQPVLVGTVSIDKSEELSRLLKREGIPHTVLNAKYHEKEAEIVAGAGKFGTVTISTNMAGRGTDIMLGGNPEFMAKHEMKKLGYEDDIIGLAVGSSVSVTEEVLEARKVYRDLYEKFREEIRPEYEKVKELGGLFIIGTERHESRRIDNQLRGRSGRQGDPGESQFFLSLDDDLMRLFGSDRLTGLVDRVGLDDDTPISAGLLSNSIENAQKQLEGNNFERRKTVLEYDDVMNQQRTVIYQQRREVLDGADLKEKITKMIVNTVSEVVASDLAGEEKSAWNFDELRDYFFGTLTKPDDFRYTEEQLADVTVEGVTEELTERAMELYESKEKLFGVDQMREIERVLLLRNVDSRWMDHLDAMDDLKDSVGLNAYAGRKPISEYRIAGADMFDEMSSAIREDTVRMILSIIPRQKEIKREAVAKVTSEGFVGAPTEKKRPVVIKKAERVGRNDPCPCGSGLKYKKCCGKGQGGSDED
ncbi:MAG: preprotein translocase subunit SecA [Lachnospiraceae bacterium]|nr:preprotein translocase subunit SecA [Lachnospiraceae bacterium]